MSRSSPSNASGFSSASSSRPRLSDLARPESPYVSPYAPIPGSGSNTNLAPTPREYSRSPSASGDTNFAIPRSPHHTSDDMMSTSRALSSKERASLVQSLRTHKVNTLIELRRVEKTLATNKTSETTEAMTQAWAHYVNSNNLLSELRALTQSYPFSSECLDEAKWMVISDSQSMKSWNYCWLVLQKAKAESLIPKHAQQLAAKPVMWGGQTPTAKGQEQLATAFMNAWTAALNQLLRHWDSPPTA